MSAQKSIHPNITAAQLVSGIPILAALGHAFGVFAINKEEQDALSDAVNWSFVLLGADAVIRTGRNIGHGIKNS